LRRFTFQKIQNWYDKKKDDTEDVVEQTRANIQKAGFDRSSKSPKSTKIQAPDYVLKSK
jgi:hypothetical protein